MLDFRLDWLANYYDKLYGNLTKCLLHAAKSSLLWLIDDLTNPGIDRSNTLYVTMEDD